MKSLFLSLTAFIFVVFALVMGPYFFRTLSQSSENKEFPLEKRIVFERDFLGNFKEGKNYSFKEILENEKGKKVVLHFWASWCAPCIEELPQIFTFAATENEKETLYFLLITGDSLQNIKKFFKRLETSPPKNVAIAFDNEGIFSGMGESMLPYTLFYDESLKYANEVRGPKNWD